MTGITPYKPIRRILCNYIMIFHINQSSSIPVKEQREHVKRGLWQVIHTGATVVWFLQVAVLVLRGMIFVLQFGHTITLNHNTIKPYAI